MLTRWPWEAEQERPLLPNRAQRRAQAQRMKAQQRKGQRAYNRSQKGKKSDG